MSKAQNIKTGEIEKTCPVTGATYRVTEWIEKGDRTIALEKELLDDSEESDE